MLTKRASRSMCGVYDCSSCDLFVAERCPGCASGNLHIARKDGTPCLVYECVRKLGMAGCHECTEPACRLGTVRVSCCPLRGRLDGEKEYEGLRARLEETRGAATRQNPGVPARTAQRMSCYLSVAQDYARRGVATVSSHQLGRAAGVRAALVRRDLSELGHCGTPGRGYAVDMLQEEIRRRLSLGEARPTVWLGAAELAGRPETRQALESANCRLVGVFDDDGGPKTAAGLRVQRLARAEEAVRKTGATVAVLAREDAARRELLQGLSRAGVKAVLNLTPARPAASANLVIEQGDITTLIFRLLSRMREGRPVRD